MNDLHELLIDTVVSLASNGVNGSVWYLDYRGPSYFRLYSELGQRPHHIKCEYDIEFVSYPERVGHIRIVAAFEDAFFRQTLNTPRGVDKFKFIDPQWTNPATTVHSVASEVLSHLSSLESRVWKHANERQQPLFADNKLFGWELDRDSGYTVCDYE